MGWLGKKKKSSSLRPLSEEEIQRKLYGDLKPELARPAGEASPSIPGAKYHTASSSTAVSAPEKPLSAKEDLFEMPPSLPEEHRQSGEFEEAKETAKSPKPPVFETPRPGVKAPPRRDPWAKQPKPKKGKTDLKPVWAALAASGTRLGNMLWAVLKALFGVIGFIFILAFKVAQLVDLRRPEVRRVLYWLAGLAILCALFLGIHLLNVKREAAMRTAPAVTRAREPVRQPVERAQPQQAVRPETPAPASPVETRETRTAPASAVPSAPAAEQDRYVIQIATYTTPVDAQRVVDDLRAQRLPGFMQELSRPSGRVYYSVFLGRYPNFRQAQLEFEAFRRTEAARPFQDAFIRTLD